MKQPIRNAGIRLALTAVAAVFLLSGCGRSLPAIDPEILAKKKSVLIITGQSLPEEERRQIEASARGKARTDGIALELTSQSSALTPELAATIKEKSYDGIIAAGEELIPGLLNIAREETGKHFVLLSSGLGTAAVSGDLPANVQWKRLDPNKKIAIWNDWVQLQKASGQDILWVSRTSEPVPSAWAPSEEADRLLLLDVYPDDTWFNQLSQLAKAIPAHWIVAYAKLDDKTVQRIRSLKIPFTDMSSGLVSTYRWESIIPSSVTEVLNPDWKGGAAFYSDDEAGVFRK